MGVDQKLSKTPHTSGPSLIWMLYDPEELCDRKNLKSHFCLFIDGQEDRRVDLATVSSIIYWITGV